MISLMWVKPTMKGLLRSCSLSRRRSAGTSGFWGISSFGGTCMSFLTLFKEFNGMQTWPLEKLEGNPIAFILAFSSKLTSFSIAKGSATLPFSSSESDNTSSNSSSGTVTISSNLMGVEHEIETRLGSNKKFLELLGFNWGHSRHGDGVLVCIRNERVNWDFIQYCWPVSAKQPAGTQPRQHSVSQRLYFDFKLSACQLKLPVPECAPLHSTFYEACPFQLWPLERPCLGD